MKNLFTSSLLRRILVGSLACVLAVTAATVVQAQQIQGFQALTGDKAARFQVPSDVKFAKRETLRGFVTERYRQSVGQAEVLGGSLTIYRNSGTGRIVGVIGARYPGLKPSNSVKLTAEQAKAIVVGTRGSEGEFFTKLMINPANGVQFYEVDHRQFDSRQYTWVDAQSGRVLESFDGLTTDATHPQPCSSGEGIGVDQQCKSLSDPFSGTDLTTGRTPTLQAGDNRQKTYDARSATSLPGQIARDTDRNDIWNTAGRTSPGQGALVDAHYFARITDNYFQRTFGFNWLTAYTSGFISTAHYSNNYNNAFWNGSQMVYGDGDGRTFVELSGDLDVVAHELTHGVTEATSDLIYRNESGALNESFSDILGAATENFFCQLIDGNTANACLNDPDTWTIGEDITPGTNGIRSLSNPNEDGDPSHYADRFTGRSDNGGVHINSGIPNHWFYLLSKGGQNAKASRATGTNVQPIGVEAAEQIAFLAFTSLPSNATFCNARSATVAAAEVLANEVKLPEDYSANVVDAWDEVGVNTTLCGSL